MARYAAAADGNWSTSGTWNTITNTPTLHASTNITIDGTARFTATFTAPNIINACTGVLLYINAVGSAGTVTVTLQESTVDTAAARTLNITSLVASGWVYFRFATPYVFTTVGAGAYRFKIQTAGAAGTTNAAADSGGSNYAYLATDSRGGVPIAGDDVWDVGHNQSTSINVTVDGSQVVGAGTDVTGINRRTIGAGVVINNGGVLSWDTAASATLTSRGIVSVFSGGEIRMGTIGAPQPTGTVATLQFNQSGTAGRHGLEAYNTGKVTLHGAPKAYYKTSYVGGSGTSGFPLTLSDPVDWAEGDEILICASSNNATNYNESENKFVKTRISATSFVLSNTSGGAESGLGFVHASGTYVLNLQRNVIIKSTTNTEGFYCYFDNTTVGDVDIDWVRIENVGANSGNKQGVTLTSNANTVSSLDYSVVYRFLQNGILPGALSSVAMTLTGNIVCNGTSSQPAVTFTNANKSFVDCFAVKNNNIGFNPNGAVATFTRCVAISNNLLTGGGNSSGWSIGASANKSTYNDCECHCNGSRGIAMSGAAKVIANNFLVGTKGGNTIDIVTAAGFIEAAYINSNFGSATFVSGYANMLGGSELSFHTLNDTTNNHVWYTNAGIARSSGAGLVDTTNKTAGNLSVRIAPESLVPGFVWEFLIGVRANSAAQVVGFAQKNAAFGTGTATVELFLPGSTVADATATLTNETGDWQVFNLAAAYNEDVAGFATVRITAKTTTPNAYVYFTDFYNGTNVLTGLQAWHNGKPTPVMTDLLGDPASVWAILTSTQTTAGTMGRLFVDNIDAVISSRASQVSVDALPTAEENADTLLKRDWTSVTGEASRSVLNALRKLRNKVSFSAGTLTTTKEDDSTAAYTQSVTQDASQNPFKEVG